MFVWDIIISGGSHKLSDEVYIYSRTGWHWPQGVSYTGALNAGTAPAGILFVFNLSFLASNGEMLSNKIMHCKFKVLYEV